MIRGRADGFGPLRKKYRKVADKAREELSVASGLQSWGMVFCNGTYDIQNHAACLARVPRTHRKGILYFVDRSIRPNSPKIPLEDCQDYIHYVLNESYWAPVFVSKDAREVFNKGVICRTNFPTRFVLSGSIALRFVHEWPEMVHSWNKLRKLFDDKDLCLMLAHHFKVKDPDGALIARRGPSNHPMFTHSPSLKLMKHVMNRDYKWLKEQHLFSFSGSYSGLTVNMPGGDNFLDRMKFPPLNSESREIERKFTNTLGLKDIIIEIVHEKRDKLEQDWAKSILELLDKEKIEDEKRPHRKPKRRVRKDDAVQWANLGFAI